MDKSIEYLQLALLVSCFILKGHMSIEKQILNKFSNVSKAFFETEFELKFLRVETRLHSMKDIEELSRKINEFVDETDKGDDVYYLDIYSAGTETSISFEELKNEIGKNVYVETKNHEVFEGNLVEAKDNILVIRYNAKGQFRKKEITKGDIKTLRRSAIVKKEKK